MSRGDRRRAAEALGAAVVARDAHMRASASLGEAREYAGLSAGQVRALTGMDAEHLRAIEAANACDPQVYDLLCLLYGADGFSAARSPGEAGPVVQCRFCHAVAVAASTSPHVTSAPERHTTQCEMLREVAARSRPTGSAAGGP